MCMNYLFKINTYGIFRQYLGLYKVQSLSWKLHLTFLHPSGPIGRQPLKAFVFSSHSEAPQLRGWEEAAPILQCPSLSDLMTASKRRELAKLLLIQYFSYHSYWSEEEADGQFFPALSGWAAEVPIDHSKNDTFFSLCMCVRVCCSAKQIE